MKGASRILDFYLDASIHVALAVWALVQVTGIVLGFAVDVHLAYFVFCGTIVCYNFIKYGVEAKKYVVVARRYHKNIQAFSLVTLGFALYHARFLSLQTWGGIGAMLVLTGLYALPLFPNVKNLRSLGILKIIMVALVWSIATVLLPCLEADMPMNREIWIEALQRLLLVLVLLIPFEIRDLKYDSPALGTLPQRFGPDKAKRIGGYVTVLFFLLTFLKGQYTLLDVIGKGTISLVLGYALFLAKREQTTYFASFWVEGIPILWWGILLGLAYL